jgi:hypothetical protein
MIALMRRIPKNGNQSHFSRIGKSDFHITKKEKEGLVAIVVLGSALLFAVVIVAQAIVEYNRTLFDLQFEISVAALPPPTIVYLRSNDADNWIGRGGSVAISWNTKPNSTNTPYKCTLGSVPFNQQWYQATQVPKTGSKNIGPLYEAITFNIFCQNNTGGSVPSAFRKISIFGGGGGAGDDDPPAP